MSFTADIFALCLQSTVFKKNNLCSHLFPESINFSLPYLLHTDKYTVSLILESVPNYHNQNFIYFFSFLSSFAELSEILDGFLTIFFDSFSFPTWAAPAFSPAAFFVVSLGFTFFSRTFSFPLSFLSFSDSFFNLFVSTAFFSFRSAASFPFLAFFLSSSSFVSSFLDSCFSFNFLSGSAIVSFTF